MVEAGRDLVAEQPETAGRIHDHLVVAEARGQVVRLGDISDTHELSPGQVRDVQHDAAIGELSRLGRVVELETTTTMSTSEDPGSALFSGNAVVDPLKKAPRKSELWAACSVTQAVAAARPSRTRTSAP